MLFKLKYFFDLIIHPKEFWKELKKYIFGDIKVKNVIDKDKNN